MTAKKFALRGLMVGVSAKKFALRAQNGPKWAFYGVPGEVFRGRVAEGAVLGKVFRGAAAERACRANFVAGQSLLERSGWEVLPRSRVHHAP